MLWDRMFLPLHIVFFQICSPNCPPPDNLAGARLRFGYLLVARSKHGPATKRYFCVIGRLGLRPIRADRARIVEADRQSRPGPL
jgi:hypothetical protein